MPGGRPAEDPEHPLYEWLEAIGQRAYLLARRMRDDRGKKISHQRIYQWVNGRRAIPKAVATAFSDLSGGKVAKSDWALMVDRRNGKYFSFGRPITKREARSLRLTGQSSTI